MVLERRIIDLPFGQGVDEYTSAANVPAGKLLELIDAQIDRPGSIKPRIGFTSTTRTVSPGGNLPEAVRIATDGDQTLWIGRTRAYVWSSAASTWLSQDYVSPIGIHARIQGERGPDVTNPEAVDSVYCNGYYVVAYLTALDALYIRCIDATSGARHARVLVAACGATAKVRLLAMGTRVIILYINAAGTEIHGRYLDPGTSTTTLSTDTTIADGYNGIGTNVDGFEACVTGSNPASNHVWIVYRHTEGGSADHRYVKIDGSLGSSSAQCQTGLATIFAITYSASAASIYCFWGDVTNGIFVERVNPTTMAIAAGPSLVDIDITSGAACILRRMSACPAAGGDYVHVVWSTQGEPGASSRQSKLCSAYVTDACAVSMTSELRNYELASSVIAIGNGVYFLAAIPVEDAIDTSVAHYDHVYRAVYVVDANQVTGRTPNRMYPVARLASDIVGDTMLDNSTVQYSLPPTLSPVVSGSTYVVAVPMSTDNRTGNSRETVTEGFDLYLLHMSEDTTSIPCNTGESLLLSGALPMHWDRQVMSELGFCEAPRCIVASSAGGGLLPNGTYSYVATYEWIDSRGVVHRSMPSAPVSHTVTGVGNNNPTIRVSTCGLTSKHDDEDNVNKILIRIYRTAAAPGAIYYYLTELNNDRSAYYVAYADSSTSDATLIANPQLYTTGNVYENVPPPPSNHLIQHGNRLACVSLDQLDTVWLSKLGARAEVPGFNGDLIVRMPFGDVTALASLENDKLIVFGKTAIGVVFGTGPTDAGQSNDWSDPRIVSTSVGCADPRSVVRFYDGIGFRDADGLIWCLTTGLELKPIGLPIQSTLESYEETQAATAHPDQDEVRWVVSHDPIISSKTSRIVVYQYALQQWSVWKVKNTSGVAGTPLGSALVTDAGSYQLATTSGYWFVENATCADPDGSYVSPSLTSSWVHLSGLQGYQRVWSVRLLGEYLGATHGVTAYLDYDYESPGTPSQTITMAAAYVTALRSNTREQIELRPIKQRCQSIRVRVDVTSAAGATVRWQGLAIECGVTGQKKPLPETSRGTT